VKTIEAAILDEERGCVGILGDGGMPTIFLVAFCRAVGDRDSDVETVTGRAWDLALGDDGGGSFLPKLKTAARRAAESAGI
jgi:hypothetical protein